MPGLLIVACLWQRDQQPATAVRLEPTEGIADAFKSHHVVMLPSGHGRRPLHDLLLSFAGDTRIQAVVNDTVVEFGSSRYQDLTHRFCAEMSF